MNNRIICSCLIPSLKLEFGHDMMMCLCKRLWHRPSLVLALFRYIQRAFGRSKLGTFVPGSSISMKFRTLNSFQRFFHTSNTDSVGIFKSHMRCHGFSIFVGCAIMFLFNGILELSLNIFSTCSVYISLCRSGRIMFTNTGSYFPL